MRSIHILPAILALALTVSAQAIEAANNTSETVCTFSEPIQLPHCQDVESFTLKVTTRLVEQDEYTAAHPIFPVTRIHSKGDMLKTYEWNIIPAGAATFQNQSWHQTTGEVDYFQGDLAIGAYNLNIGPGRNGRLEEIGAGSNCYTSIAINNDSTSGILRMKDQIFFRDSNKVSHAQPLQQNVPFICK
ncbi:MAG: hypothetical protein ACXWQO_01445 [Bdellovibrionota bacterium]